MQKSKYNKPEVKVLTNEEAQKILGDTIIIKIHPIIKISDEVHNKSCSDWKRLTVCKNG